MTREQIDALVTDISEGVAQATKDYVQEIEQRLIERIERLERGGVDGTHVESAVRQALEKS